jgi:hypothetical protein
LLITNVEKRNEIQFGNLIGNFSRSVKKIYLNRKKSSPLSFAGNHSLRLMVTNHVLSFILLNFAEEKNEK